MNDYDPSPGVDVTVAGETLPDEPAYEPRPPRFVSTPKEFFWTRDIYQAATLHVYGIPFLRAERRMDGKIEWMFDNVLDKAFQLGREYRMDSAMMVPVHAFHASYKLMARAADTARKEGTYQNDNAA